MNNNKILAIALFLTFIFAVSSYTFAVNNSFGIGIGGHSFSGTVLTEEQKVKMEELRTLLTKQKSGETLTSEEQAKLEELKATQPGKFGNYEKRGFGKGMGMGMMKGNFLLTEEEKAGFEAMTNEERQEYMETKMEENKVKLEKKEAVLDKLLNLQTLTAEEELIRQEIIKERTERKTEFKLVR